MQALPCVQVKNLPPSASFYSAVTQPLGLRFTSANSSAIVFGNPEPTFEVKTGINAPRPTRIVLSVSSPLAVTAFHAAARRANPNGNSNIRLKEDDGLSGESRASATDLEGNVMEIVYLPPDRPGSAARQATRVLEWNLDVATSTISAARSVVSSISQSRPGLATIMPTTDDESCKIIRRSLTTSTVESTSPQQQASRGLSTGATVGTVLGAVAAGAIGAGLAYAFIKKDRDRALRQEFEAPPFQRRATYPEPHPDHQPRYVELERTVEKVRYPEQYPPGPNQHPHPSYTTRRPEAGNPFVEVDDRASRHSPNSRMRDRSPRKPLMITETEHKSNVGLQLPEPPHPATEVEPVSQAETRHTANPKSQLHAELFKRRHPVASRAPSKAPSQAPDARSHVSSRSRRGDDDRRSHAGSRHSTVRPPHDDTKTYVSARTDKSATTVRPAKTQSKAPSRAASYVSARDIPSPPKESDWQDLVDEDDKASVAPSDSISCVGEERPSK
ncbi:hypothetical protein RRF57_001260 [Xylaria bambusicola]|uniref:Uncharacterized protein n=1 Tax=Xylaria bambusicola TaxID=326684 RepID=A0AAN7UGD2_9PEZI